ncbi:MAG: sulfotransferase [Actinomycetota bacterium]|nr:sulfotransferase [Actinomycetota bacterium]
MPHDTFISKHLRPRRLRGRAEPGPPAPFVVGVGRSGTTLLRLMLDAHPQMAVPPETHFFESVLDASGRFRFGPEQVLLAITEDPRRRWNDFGLGEDELLDRFEAIPKFNVSDALRAFYALYAEKQGKPRWGDKTPPYVTTMRRIKRVLPEARFIHVIRDGRDVTLSNNKRIAERGHREPVPAARAARRWRNRIEKARADGPHLGEYLEIRYEDLVVNTEPALRKVCDYIALDFDPVMLRYHETAAERLAEMAGAMPARDGRPERDAGERLKAHALATKPPTKERIEVWREDMSAEDQEAFERVAGELLDDLGYARAGSA